MIRRPGYPSWWRRQVFTPPNEAEQLLDDLRAARPDTIAELRDALACARQDAKDTTEYWHTATEALWVEITELRATTWLGATDRERQLLREVEQLKRNLLALEDRLARAEGRRVPVPRMVSR